MRRSRTKRSAQRVADIWNTANPVIGTPVTVTLDTGEQRETVTRSAAEVLGGHTAVVWLEGIVGCYDLRRVRPR